MWLEGAKASEHASLYLELIVLCFLGRISESQGNKSLAPSELPDGASGVRIRRDTCSRKGDSRKHEAKLTWGSGRLGRLPREGMAAHVPEKKTVVWRSKLALIPAGLVCYPRPHCSIPFSFAHI